MDGSRMRVLRTTHTSFAEGCDPLNFLEPARSSLFVGSDFRRGTGKVMKILVTGAAGFIGFHTAKRLIERGDEVVGFDVVNDYYDPSLKEARLSPPRQVGEDGARRLAVHPRRPHRSGWRQQGVQGAVRPGDPSCGAGRRPAQPQPSARLYQLEHRWVSQHPGGLPGARHAAPHLCIDVERLWRQSEDAVLRA